jgi:hypothetical protein
VELQVTVEAQAELIDFEVQIASYFDATFPQAGVWTTAGAPTSSPANLGVWHAFPRDAQTTTIIGDGRWQHGGNPVKFAIRSPYTAPLSIRRHTNGKLVAVQRSKPEDCFAIYTAHDGEAHFSNYQALFGRTIPAGTKASASVTLSLGEWSDAEILEDK